MTKTIRTIHESKAERIRIETPLGFDDVLRRLKAQTGKTTVPEINKVAASTQSAEEFDAEVTRRFVGPSGFMLFAEIEHSTWIGRYGIDRRVQRIILGNPLVAITMMREDISAGLFAPVELLLVEETAGSTLYYVRPSTLMVTVTNPPLQSAAQELDRKLAYLAAGITAFTGDES